MSWHPYGQITNELHVSDLHPLVTEVALYDKFRAVGEVRAVSLCRHPATRASRGFAHVIMAHRDDAKRAIEELNGELMENRPIRIMWSHRDPSVIQASSKSNVFIKNLAGDIDSKALRDIFRRFGNILSWKVATDEEGVSKGYGFVHFEREVEAAQAIQELNGEVINGLKVYVGPFQSAKDRIESQRDKFTNVFFKNLPASYGDEELVTTVAEYGEIVSAKVMMTKDGESKEFGFVNFENTEAAHKVVAELHGTDVDGKELYVGAAMKKNLRRALLKKDFEERKRDMLNKNLFVKHLEDEMDDEALKKMFQKFGTVTSAKVMYGTTSSGYSYSKGFGFVSFEKQEEAKAAIKGLHYVPTAARKPLYVTYAQLREDRDVRMAQAIAQISHVRLMGTRLHSVKVGSTVLR